MISYAVHAKHNNGFVCVVVAAADVEWKKENFLITKQRQQLLSHQSE